MKSLLRFLAAGSVDDGKSTLIGRLLYDSGGVYEDQLASVRKATAGSNGNLDLSLITDGLKAEREQAITIDVAYRYFATANRKFIVADTPGHEQYTRNMVTAASTADLALILVDARKGLLEQTKRHAYIAWLLGVRTMIVAVNKMDLVGFDRERFCQICESFRRFALSTTGVQHHFVPISALGADNVVCPSQNMSWYAGPTLLQLLETIAVEENDNGASLRFPVQYVIRPHQDFRGYAGQIVSGTARPDQEVLSLPSRYRTRISRILIHERDLAEAVAPQSVVLCLTDQVDLSRGDMLIDAKHLPMVCQRIVASLIWLSPSPLRVGAPYLIRHTSQTLCGCVLSILHTTEFNALAERNSATLQLNDIAKVELETHKPMFCEPYAVNRALGSFIVIDPVSNATVAAGTILEACPSVAGSLSVPVSILGGVADSRSVGLTVWFTGLSGAGKTTLCNAVHTELLARGMRTEILDGDAVRKHLNSDLGFSKEDRDENVRRIGFVARLLTRNGVVVLVACISPYRDIRAEIRHSINAFLEVHVNAPLEVCEGRDPKGLYRKARAGEIPGFTGIEGIYEPPSSPEIRCDTDRESIRTCTDRVVEAIVKYLSSGNGARIGNSV